jgi:hypothetical protein
MLAPRMVVVEIGNGAIRRRIAPLYGLLKYASTKCHLSYILMRLNLIVIILRATIIYNDPARQVFFAGEV